MLEEDLKRIVRLHPSLVEDGLSIDHEEYLIRSLDGRPYRCDLKGKDKDGRLVYIELKLRAGHSVVYQVAKYKTFAPDEGRFVVAALEVEPETAQVLGRLGFESIVIDQARASALLAAEKSNPALYQRLDAQANSGASNLTDYVSRPIYTQDEAGIVRAFMADLSSMIDKNPDIVRPFSIQGLDVREGDKYRLLLGAKEYPTDKLLIYNRARKRDEIHLLYVPDFSFTTRNATPRKLAFTQYVADKSEQLSSALGCPFAKSSKNIKETHLEISRQAWKGLSLVLIRDVNLWGLADFSQVVTHHFFDYCDVVIPFMQEFQAWYSGSKM